jgi:Rrf2 family protein
MIKLNRTTEYGLIALRHMSRKAPGTVTSAREIADCYGLPFEITAKTLQRLKDTGLIQSAQGARGGYMLQRALREVSLADFLELMEGPQNVVGCVDESAAAASKAGCGCEYEARCEMKDFMTDLNRRMREFLRGIRLTEITEGPRTLAGSFRELPMVAAGGEP